MTNRNKRVKVYNPQRRDKKALPKKDKPSKVLRNLCVLLQSILGTFIVLCFFAYTITSRVHIFERGAVENRNVSFYDLSNDYYRSDVFSDNFQNYVEAMIRYVTISEQITRNGKYDPDIVINVGEYAHRNAAGEYKGPKVEYKLGDLLKWGEMLYKEGSICTYEFYSFEAYCKFFNILPEDISGGDFEAVNNTDLYDSFETLKDNSDEYEFLTVEGKFANEYVSDSRIFKRPLTIFIITMRSLQQTVIALMRIKHLSDIV